MVSIIVPIYNVEMYLSDCIETVLKLETDFEVILVDDGSTDKSGILCDELAQKDSRIKVIHQMNGGLSAARNAGIKYAKGEFLLFLDSDDFLDPKETDEMLKNLSSDVDVLLGLYRKYYTEENEYEKEECEGFLKIEGNISVDEFLKVIPKDGQSCYMTAWRFVVKKEFVLKNDLLFLPDIYHEDEEWTQRLVCSTKNIFVTHKFFYQYRQARAGAITGSVKEKNIEDRITILNRAVKLIENNIDDKNKTEYLKYRMSQLYLGNMIDIRILSSIRKKEIIEKLKPYRKTCSKYMSGTIGRVAMVLDRVFGLSVACSILKVLRKLLKK